MACLLASVDLISLVLLLNLISYFRHSWYVEVLLLESLLDALAHLGLPRAIAKECLLLTGTLGRRRHRQQFHEYLRILLHEADDLLPFLIFLVGVLMNLGLIHRKQIVGIQAGVAQLLLNVLHHKVRVVDIDELL